MGLANVVNQNLMFCLSVPPTMTKMQESQWVEHFPIASLGNNSPVEFIIPPQTECWTDLSQSYLYVNSTLQKQMVLT